jgi:hypothetical protein
MNRPSPAAALNGVQVGHICDCCNCRIRTGDKAVVYATYYEDEGWLVRRVWCSDCGSTTIGLPTDGADEVVIEAVFWNHRLTGVKTVDRSKP